MWELLRSGYLADPAEDLNQIGRRSIGPRCADDKEALLLHVDKTDAINVLG